MGSGLGLVRRKTSCLAATRYTNTSIWAARGRGLQGGCAAVAGERRTHEQVCELAQALECRGALRPRRVGRDRGRERGAVVGDIDGGVGEEVEHACGLARLLAAERREVELRLG